LSVKRIYFLGGTILFIFAALILRVAIIQFVPDRSLEEAAFRQRVSSTAIERIRGNILDRNDIPFTNRNEKYSALVKTAYMPQSDEERKIVCNALGVDAEILNGLTSKSKPFLIETDKEGHDALIEMNVDWVSMINSVERYDEGSLAKHIIGYLNRSDQIGQAGIEKAYEKILRDNAVFEIGTVTDAAKKPIKGFGYKLKNWSDGDRKLNVKLTLDYHVQRIVEEAMEKAGISGAVVVEDVVTGDILAMASKPDFDQNAVEKYLDSSDKELFNKATAAYNLGSIFKIIDAAAYFENEDSIVIGDIDKSGEGSSLDDGGKDDGTGYPGNATGDEYRFFDGYTYGLQPFIYEPYDFGYYDRYHGFDDPDHYYCTGAVDINGLTFKCYSYYQGGHGDMDLEKAFALSCNSYFIELCQKIGYKSMIGMAKKFGLGSKTGISEQGIPEASGNLPDMDAYYSSADIANLAIGQGVMLATPLQVADLTATIANGGIKNRVNIVDSITDSNGNIVKQIRKSEGERIISKDTSDKIRSLMEAVTLNGTGTEAVMGYYGGAGGKTGSAETGSEEIVHAWFAGYFPAAGPRYSIAVFAEDGRLGGKSAAPVFAGIAKGMLEKGY
jgi:peptidoglycan glycosyltransferase/penicillin-binding protein 2